MRSERPGQHHPVNRLNLQLVHQESEPGIERGLGQLDGTNIILGDRHGLRDTIAEGPAILLNPGGNSGFPAINLTILGDDAGQIHLGDDLNNA